MKIAQLAPLHESVPPKAYGGTERIVHYLTEELTRRGHEVTLFASGDSVTSAKLVPVLERSLRLHTGAIDHVPYVLLQLGKVYDRALEFDIIHSHLDYFAFPMARLVSTPTITTLHGRLDLKRYHPVFHEFREAALVSISNRQRTPLPDLNWVATVYNGIDPTEYVLQREPGEYLAFLGRISPEKGIDKAIEIATSVGMPLKIAAKVDPSDEQYYENVIKPLLNNPLVEYLGEIDQEQKSRFLGNAAALLFPICWPEPFGLVMIEAMACGTPVIALRNGSVDEILIDGKTGFICDSIEEMKDAIDRLGEIDRAVCRLHVIRSFSVDIMARNYENVYKRILGSDENGQGK